MANDDTQIGRAFIGLREMLLHGELVRGERISELPLVARLGTSRTPIRLALERLAHMGLLDVLPTGGFAVRGFSLAEALDAIELRGVLEGTAARFAVERLKDDSELSAMRRACSQMEALGSLTIDTFEVYMDLTESFHAGLVDLARSAILQRHIAQVSSLPFASASAMVFPTSVLPNADAHLLIANDQHRSIIEALVQRQSARAEGLAREHAHLARRVLSVAMSDTDALRRIPGAPLIHVETV
jgi:GntR family transcriptional regulator of vanillate catabolism